MRAAADSAGLLSFAEQFWQTVGARMTREGSAFSVELPGELRAHFGKDALRFALTAQEAWASGAEILAPGSFLLERMYEYIKDKGFRAFFHLPARDSLGPAGVRKEVLRRVRPGNAKVVSATSAEAWPALLSVDFKVIYQTDEREEELLRVIEGEDGRMAAAEVEPRAGWAAAEPAPPEVASRLAASDVTARYERAEREARRVAVHNGRAFEKASLARLAENLSRIRGYFGQIRGEIGGDDESRAERLAELEAEERLKTEEEVDAHRVRVRLVPLAVSLLGVPTRRVTLSLQGRDEKRSELRCDWDLARETLHIDELDPRHEVGPGGVDVALCRGGHVTLADRVRPCAACAWERCDEHGGACPTCSEPLCASCGARCALCDRRHCPRHAPLPCVVCGRPSCGPCSGSCASCGGLVCRDDATPCAVCGKPVCASDVMRCGCGEVVCPAEIVVDAVSQIRYCRRCAITCADCGRAIGRATSLICSACGARLCRDDARSCASCRPAGSAASPARLCGKHGTRCNACGKDLCRARHRRRCRVCAQDSCADCLDSAGRCSLCLLLHRGKGSSGPPALAEPPPEAASIREWHTQAGVAFDLHLGKGRSGGLLMVTDKGGKLVKVLRK